MHEGALVDNIYVEIWERKSLNLHFNWIALKINITANMKILSVENSIYISHITNRCLTIKFTFKHLYLFICSAILIFVIID